MRSTIPAFLLFLAPVSALAQGNGNDCLADLKMPAVGRWAEYKGLMKGKDTSSIRYAVVGAEQREGKDLKWLELRMTGAKGTTIFQMLTSGSPADVEQVQEVVTKFGDKPAAKLPPMMVQALRGQVSQSSFMANLCEGVAPAGQESVTVPAGTFNAIRYHNTKHESDTWVVPTLPFVVVKSKGKNFEMSLVSSGAGAKSSITEKPQEMSFPSK